MVLLDGDWGGQRDAISFWFSQVLSDPLVPVAVEVLQDADALSLGDDGVVDGVVGHQLEVFQSPVEAHCCCEVVHRSVLVTEFAWVVGTDGNGIPETK